MNDEQREKLKKLAERANELIVKATMPVFLSEEYLKIERAVTKECGAVVFDRFVALIWKSQPAFMDGDIATISQETTHKTEIVSNGDMLETRALSIKLPREDLEEIKEALMEAHRERKKIDDSTGVPAPNNLMPGLKKLTDSRLNEEIINSILTLAQKLEWDSRLFLADNLNASFSGLVPYLPEDEQLADDAF